VQSLESKGIKVDGFFSEVLSINNKTSLAVCQVKERILLKDAMCFFMESKYSLICSR
jgi:hypothetical protein